ncbi:hypothetical protein LAUMK35_02501 [Mycobacterium pseudokansasii]|nr:hypothetical protein LAUMK35_02501 [Mycobacterium pseudokansasii]
MLLAPPLPPLPYKNPPGPPACPGPPLVPSPINGRPNSAWLGALITPSTSCSTVCNGEALAASALAYQPAADVKPCANRAWNVSAWALIT